MSGHRILYLPIEIKARELFGKVWLASRAVERGWVVVMGDHKDIRRYAEEHALGVHVEISIPERKAALQEKLSKAGHRVVNLCEESIIYVDAQDYCLRKVGPTALRWTDLFFCPGGRNAQHISECFPEHRHKVAITGNPRFDILRPELRDIYETEARAIRKQQGSFLLVNTNFGRSNPAKPRDDYVDYLISRKVVQPGEHAEFNRRFTAFKQRQIQGFRGMLAELARSGQVNRILVRPHPSENHDAWREWGKPFGIEVKYEGSANAWALAADAVLHPGCTTGIEALLLDRPTISYMAEPDNEFVNLADSVSEPVKTAEEVLDRLNMAKNETSAARRERYAGQRTKLDSHIASIELPYAVDRILDELDRLDVPLATAAQAGLNGRAATGLFGRIRTWLDQPNMSQSQLKKQKYAGLRLDDITVPASCWKRLGKVSRVPKINHLDHGLFALS